MLPWYLETTPNDLYCFLYHYGSVCHCPMKTNQNGCSLKMTCEATEITSCLLAHLSSPEKRQHWSFVKCLIQVTELLMMLDVNSVMLQYHRKPSSIEVGWISYCLSVIFFWPYQRQPCLEKQQIIQCSKTPCIGSSDKLKQLWLVLMRK